MYLNRKLLIQWLYEFLIILNSNYWGSEPFRRGSLISSAFIANSFFTSTSVHWLFSLKNTYSITKATPDRIEKSKKIVKYPIEDIKNCYKNDERRAESAKHVPIMPYIFEPIFFPYILPHTVGNSTKWPPSHASNRPTQIK